MLRIDNIRLEVGESEGLLPHKAAHILCVEREKMTGFQINKKSLDARKKADVHYVYSICVSLDGESEERFLSPQVRKYKAYSYPIPKAESKLPPVIVGFGPAGIFCALILARAGMKPVVLERGEDADSRKITVQRFWQSGVLDPESNVQFGEGGAGAFSDGKLNTGIKNERVSFVLETFFKHGAPKHITYDAKPHIGTDILTATVKSMRAEIISLGGQVLFLHKFTGWQNNSNNITVFFEHKGKPGSIAASELVLALGHSSRDTLCMLYDSGIKMEQKAFSMGARIEHPQSLVNSSQFGEFADNLPPADYKLSCSFNDGSSAYTFCMCPGGYVVAAASEEGGVVTNGMSLSSREGNNANSALLVTLTPKDFPGLSPLSGMYWQREIEQQAYRIAGGYRAPAQLTGDFLGLHRKKSFAESSVKPTYRPGIVFTELDKVLPKEITKTMRQAIPAFAKKLKGFDMYDSIITAPETRSSSPVRILRDKSFQSSVPGLYPCGEGAGYAGGIVSSAVDGMRIAEAIIALHLIHHQA